MKRYFLSLIFTLFSIVLLGCATQVQSDLRQEAVTEIPAQKQPEQQNEMSFFITSVGTGKGADLGGLAGADFHCWKLADAVGAGDKTWRAYLSTAGENGVDARDRIGNGPWYNARGELIADNVEELHDNASKLVKTTQLNEKAEIVNGRGDTPNRHDILTGSGIDGRLYVAGTNDTTCNNWMSRADGIGSARVGHHDRIGGGQHPTSWNSAHNSRGCSQENLRSTGGDGLFYCFATNEPFKPITEHIVEITEQGYNPSNLSIKRGDRVTWINKDTRENWPASAMHPTHTRYPGSDIEKCGTLEEEHIFDACSSIKTSESYSFTFNNNGTWPYHNHLNAKAPFFGRIIVE